MTSRPSSPATSTVAEDETLQLALTLMSLPASSHRSCSPPQLPQQESFSPSSIGSWVDLPPQSSTSDQAHPTTDNDPYQDRTSRRRVRMSKPKAVRQGLANLPPAPSPFGTQLEPSSRSTPYTHTPEQHRRRFNPRPKPRELSVENDELPRPDPDEFYAALLSAYDSAKSLAGMWGQRVARVLTMDGKKDLRVQVAKVGLGLVLVCRPRWVLGAMNVSWSVLRNPWRAYHYTLYSAFIARVLLS